MHRQTTCRLPLISAGLALAFCAASARAGTIYVATATGPFGTVDSGTGTFTQIGATLADPLGGLVSGTNGYLGVSFAGNLDSIDPRTGAVTVIGATGLGGNALDTAEVNGAVYVTDFSNNIYTINTSTGAAILLGYKGIPAAPELTINPNDFCDEALFTVNGNLYATFDGIDGDTLSPVISPELYRINTATGQATHIAPTTTFLTAAAVINGTLYGFRVKPATFTSDLVTLNLIDGITAFVSNIGSPATLIDGAAATPEPGSIVLIAIGIAAIAVGKRRSLGASLGATARRE